MARQAEEDVPYTNVDDFALADEEANDNDEEQTVETILIRELRTYLDEAEQEHTGWDLIDLTEAAKMTPTQQIAVHKLVIQHIRNLRETINNRVKEN